MEYFGISEWLFERLCSFHFGDTVEFSLCVWFTVIVEFT